MIDLELFPKLSKFPYTNQCMVRMVSHPRGESTDIRTIPQSTIHGPLVTISNLHSNHVIIVHQLILDCLNHEDSRSVCPLRFRWQS